MTSVSCGCVRGRAVGAAIVGKKLLLREYSEAMTDLRKNSKMERE